MIRFSDLNRKFLQTSSQIASRNLTAQAAVSFKPKDDAEFSKARPFGEIPGLTKLQLIRSFIKGGKFHNKSIIEVQTSLRREFGDFYRMPGMFGQTTNLLTFDANDVEFVHRNEGTYPYRRGMETLGYFRKNVRSDIFDLGGLVME